jgi:hypothetical protein
MQSVLIIQQLTWEELMLPELRPKVLQLQTGWLCVNLTREIQLVFFGKTTQ